MDKSSLINEDENNRFKSLYSHRCKILGVAVARLYISSNNEWKYTDTGLAALLKDNERRNYFLQLVNMDHFKLSREFEILWNCKYEKFQNQVHTFSGTEDVILLSFADLNESNNFELEIKGIIKTRNAQKQKKRESAINNQANGNMVNYSMQNIETKATISKSETKVKTNKKGTKARITKSDISNPSNFQHLDHMGLNDHFFEDPNDENLKKFLKDAKLDKLLDDDRSKKDIYDFVESHGGFTKLENEMKQKENKERRAPSIPKPPVNGSQKPPPPPPPFRPPTTQTSQYVPPMNVNQKPIVPQGSVPPPPQPPPPPPPPQPPSIVVPSVSKPSQNKPNVGGSDSRGGLLSEITSFDTKKLKASSQIPRNQQKIDDPTESSNAGGGGSILVLLQNFLQERQAIMAPTNSDSESQPESEEEWND